jgi:hypothetical protein
LPAAFWPPLACASAGGSASSGGGPCASRLETLGSGGCGGSTNPVRAIAASRLGSSLESGARTEPRPPVPPSTAPSAVGVSLAAAVSVLASGIRSSFGKNDQPLDWAGLSELPPPSARSMIAAPKHNAIHRLPVFANRPKETNPVTWAHAQIKKRGSSRPTSGFGQRPRSARTAQNAARSLCVNLKLFDTGSAKLEGFCEDAA